jgi:hypothetical protein
MISLHPRFARRTRHSLGCGALHCPVLLPPIRPSAYAPDSQPTTAEIAQRGMQGESFPLPVGDTKNPETKTASGGQRDDLPAPSVRTQDAAQSRLRRVVLPCAAPPIRSSAYAPDSQPTAAEITQRGCKGNHSPCPAETYPPPDTKTASGGQGDNLPAPSVRAQDAAQSRLRRVALPCAASPHTVVDVRPGQSADRGRNHTTGDARGIIPLARRRHKKPRDNAASGGQLGLSVFPGILHLPQEQFRHRLIPVKRTVSGVKSRENETRCA